MSTTLIESLVELPASMLDDELRAAERERRAIESRLAAITAVAEQRMQFMADGHRSMSGYLKAHLNCSGVEANRLRRLAKLLNEHPGAGAAFGSGCISTSNMDLVARAWSTDRGHDEIAACVPLLLEHAERFSTKDFRVIVDRVVTNADVDGNDPGDDHDANASVNADHEGLRASITGGTTQEAAEIKAVFDLAVEAEFMVDVAARRDEFGDAADQHPLPRTGAQRRFAAEHAIHMAYVSTPAGTQRPEPLVNILFSADAANDALVAHGLVVPGDVFGVNEVDPCIADAGASDHRASDASDGALGTPAAADLATRRCETSTGVPIHPDAALKAMIRGRVRRVVLDSRSVVTDLGPSRRLFTGAARQAAQLIVLSCSHPGCDVAAEFCEVDHLQRHADGGPTDQHNAGPACRSHNVFKETAGLRSRRAVDGRVYLIRADGSVILPVGARTPRWAHEDPLPRQSPVEPPPDAETPSNLRANTAPSPGQGASADTKPSVAIETVSFSEYLERGTTTRVAGTWQLVRCDLADLIRGRPA